MLKSLLLHMSTSPFWSERLPRYRAVRRSVRRFMPGEGVDEALEAARFPAVLTLLGENLTGIEQAVEVRDHYLDLVERVRSSRLDVEISVKPTQFGLDIDPGFCTEAMIETAAACAEAGSYFWIDMESTPYLDRTLDLYESVRKECAPSGVCLQAYLRRTRDDWERLKPLSPSIRLVKGAYAEPAALAFEKKGEVDAAYEELGCAMLAARAAGAADRIVFGTHDDRLIDRLDQEGRALGADDEPLAEFHLLYGIRTALQKEVAGRGTPVRVLISYGPAWFPWYMRRLAERPANVGFVLRNLFR